MFYAGEKNPYPDLDDHNLHNEQDKKSRFASMQDSLNSSKISSINKEGLMADLLFCLIRINSSQQKNKAVSPNAALAVNLITTRITSKLQTKMFIQEYFAILNFGEEDFSIILNRNTTCTSIIT